MTSLSLACPSREISDASGRAGARERGWRLTSLSSLLTILSYFSLRCEYEESASDIVDHGLERQPVRSRKSNDSKSRARTDHPGARDRVGELVYGYQVDDKQSRRLARPLWNRALWYGSQGPEPNRKKSDPAEPLPFIDSFPRAPVQP